MPRIYTYITIREQSDSVGKIVTSVGKNLQRGKKYDSVGKNLTAWERFGLRGKNLIAWERSGHRRIGSNFSLDQNKKVVKRLTYIVMTFSTT